MALFHLRPDAAAASHAPAPLAEPAVRRWAGVLRARWTAHDDGPGAGPDTGAPLWIAGNQVELMSDGLATSRALLAAVDSARDHINLEGSLATSDLAGRELAEHLIARRRAGVKLHLLLDSAARHPFSGVTQQALRDSGAQLCQQRPGPARRQMIVDGRLAFVCAAETATRPPAVRDSSVQPVPARDTLLRAQGPAVAALQRLFIADWQAGTGRRPLLAHYFPRLLPIGQQALGIVPAGSRARDAFGPTLLGAIEQAQQRIHLTATRFMPSRRLLQALSQAAGRGVQVRLLLPGFGESAATLQAGRARYAPLLRAGLQVFERRQALQHAGAAVVDGHWAALGPDRLGEDGDTLIVRDKGFASRLEANLAGDIARSVEINAHAWRQRGWLQRLRETAARAGIWTA